MSRPPSEPPPEDEPVVTLEKQPDAIPSSRSDLGLSKAQLAEVVKAMVVVVRRVGCPVHDDPLDVVNDAFVVALSKPISERPSIEEWKRFVAWMCKFAIHAALTNRKSKHRKLLSAGHSDDDIAAFLSMAGHAEALDARHDLHKVFMVLKPADQELLRALYIDGKTIQEMSLELNEPWTTVKSRYQRALDLLYAALQAVIATIVLFFPKNARAQSARLVRHMSRLVPQVTQTATAMTVTVVCGVIVPASSMATIERYEAPVATVAAAPKPTFAASMALSEPPLTIEVEPVKPIAIDELQKQWSAGDMKATTIVSYLQATMLPFAFLVTPAVTQLACAGAERQTTAPQEPEEGTDGVDPYEMMCSFEHRRGSDCPTKAEWYASMGRCPDGTKGCQK